MELLQAKLVVVELRHLAALAVVLLYDGMVVDFHEIDSLVRVWHKDLCEKVFQLCGNVRFVSLVLDDFADIEPIRAQLVNPLQLRVAARPVEGEIKIEHGK